MRAAPLFALALSACGAPTSLLFDVSLQASAPMPATLRLTLYAPENLGSSRAVPVARLPGTLLAESLDARRSPLRWMLDGLDASGKVSVQAVGTAALAAGREVEVAAALGKPLADADGDGVPDLIDDCPTTPDPNQDCAPIFDLSGLDRAADLAGADFAGVDLAGDFAAPRDFSTVAVPDLADAGNPPCPSSHIFCDDFESGTLSPANWTTSTLAGGDTLAVDGVRPWRGTKSLHAVGTNQASNHQAIADYALPTTMTTVAARQYVYSPTGPGNFGLVMQLYAGNFGVSVGADSNGDWVSTEDNNGSTVDHTSSVPYPAATWICLELVATMSGGTQTITIYADGQQLIQYTPAQTDAFGDFYTGYCRVPPNYAGQVFVDDVAIANTRVGCE